MSNDSSPTIQDVLDAINDFATDTGERFNGIAQRFEKIDLRFEKIDLRFEKIESRLTRVEATMVTKDYLDMKLSDLKGDLVLLMRKEDIKLKALIEILYKKDVLSEADTKKLFNMDPFPQASL